MLAELYYFRLKESDHQHRTEEEIESTKRVNMWTIMRDYNIGNSDMAPIAQIKDADCNPQAQESRVNTKGILQECVSEKLREKIL